MPVDWANIALLSTAIIGLVNIIDSHLISRRMPSLAAFLLPASIITLVVSLVAASLFPLPSGLDGPTILIAVFSGVLRTFSLGILLFTFRMEEVSRVIPVYSTFPVFVAIMAVPLLGEAVGLLQWLAIIVVVAGAVVVSAKRSPGGSNRRLGRVFILLLVSSLLMAGANIASKHVLDSISSWNMYWITGLAVAAGFMLFSLRPRVLRELVSLKRRGAVLGLLLFNELLVVAGVLLLFVAMQNGPVSLVSAIFSSRPIFVLIFAFAISRTFPNFLKWETGKGVLAQRVVGTALVVAGIAAIYLS